MKTTIENLMLIEGATLEKYDKYSLVTIYDKKFRQIHYRFYDGNKFDPDVFIDDTDVNTLTDLHYFDNIEDVINQVYYITGKRIKIKEYETI